MQTAEIIISRYKSIHLLLGALNTTVSFTSNNRMQKYHNWIQAVMNPKIILSSKSTSLVNFFGIGSLLYVRDVGANSEMKQSISGRITCNLLRARKSRAYKVCLVFVFLLIRRKTDEIFKPDTKRSNHNRVISLESLLKTDLQTTVACKKALQV